MKIYSTNVRPSWFDVILVAVLAAFLFAPAPGAPICSLPDVAVASAE